MEPKTLKEDFISQLERVEKEIGQLRAALGQRQELALKLQGAIEAMQLQLGEEPESPQEEATTDTTEQEVAG
jgi:hypothetical protein